MNCELCGKVKSEVKDEIKEMRDKIRDEIKETGTLQTDSLFVPREIKIDRSYFYPKCLADHFDSEPQSGDPPSGKMITTDCSHLFHKKCLADYFDSERKNGSEKCLTNYFGQEKKNECPICGENIHRSRMILVRDTLAIPVVCFDGIAYSIDGEGNVFPEYLNRFFDEGMCSEEKNR